MIADLHADVSIAQNCYMDRMAVEICLGGNWSTICGYPSPWDQSNAAVICQQLGFKSSSKTSMAHLADVTLPSSLINMLPILTLTAHQPSIHLHRWTHQPYQNILSCKIWLHLTPQHVDNPRAGRNNKLGSSVHVPHTWYLYPRVHSITFAL